MTARGPAADDGAVHRGFAARESALLDSFLDTRADPAARFAELMAVDAELGLDPLALPDFVVFAGDWHGDGGAAADAMQQARVCPGPAVVLQLGDWGCWTGTQGVRYANIVAESARVLGVTTLRIDGNHEAFDLLEQYPVLPNGLRVIRPRVYHLPRGHRWSWGGLRFAVLGGAVSVDKAVRTPGVSWWWQEAITWAEAERAIAGGPADVLLSHDVPLGVRVPGLIDPRLLDPLQLRASEQNRAVLREVVEAVRPAHVFHGHMHRRYDATMTLGDDTQVAVAGLADGRDRENSRLTVRLSDLAASVARIRAANNDPTPAAGRAGTDSARGDDAR